MAPANKNISTIALALAGMTASMDIPKHKCHDAGFWDGRESFAAVAAKSLNINNKHRGGLPTPPNSISPPLVPQGFKVRAAQAPPTPPAAAQMDSDLDLQDAVDHANAQDHSQHVLCAARGLNSLADMDAAGVITPGLLAKHHLPGILLDHGPLAIRHVMGFLTTSVPGFSGIPPAKARRLVGRALEGHGSDGELGGIYADVIFEKVGWGRWDARRRGELSRNSRNRERHENQGRTSPQSQGLQIPRHGARFEQDRQGVYGTSTAGESAMFSHDSEMDYDHPLEDISMLEDEADNMSLDGDSSCSSSEPPDDNPILVYDAGDVTDEEDWASIGAAALRKGSYPPDRSGATGRLRNNYPYARHLDPKARGRGGGPPLSMLAAKPISMPPNTKSKLLSQQPALLNQVSLDSRMVGFGSSDPQERDAIEALVRLSSV